MMGDATAPDELPKLVECRAAERRTGAPFIIETLPDPQFLALTGPEGEVSPDRQPRIAR